MATTELRAGLEVTASVRLLRPLGSGAMGELWVGEHRALETEVAVKFIKREAMAREERALERFRREAKAAARIKSPHVVQVFDHGVMDDGTPYIVMELCDGETLGERIDRAGAVPAAEVALIVEQIARALAAAHAIGIVHRDVKPDNIFLLRQAGSPFAKLLDFGIAKHTELEAGAAATQSGTVVGTPQYMSPEQLLRAEPEPAADLWGLAATAYHALAGVPPFVGETLAAVIVAVTRANYARPSARRPELGAAIDAWFERAFCLEADVRFATAEKLAASFSEAVRGVEPNTGTIDLAQPKLASSTAEFIAEQSLGLGAPSERQPHSAAPPAEPGSTTATAVASSKLPPARGRIAWLGLVLAAAVAGFFYLRAAPSPRRGEGWGGGLPASASPAGATPATASPSASAPRVLALLPALAPTTIQAGFEPSGEWVTEYTIARYDGDQGASWLEADGACREHGMGLCSEPQWQRACGSLSELGGVETWTMSASGERGFVTRGGERGCLGRRIVAGGERDERRGGACCTRAVAIASHNRNLSFVQETSRKILLLERALNGVMLKEMSSLFSDKVIFNTHEFSAAGLMKAVHDRAATLEHHWIAHERCEVSFVADEKQASWGADCRSVMREDGRIASMLRRYAFSGDDGRLERIAEPEIYRKPSPP